MTHSPTKFCVATAEMSPCGHYRYDLQRHWRPNAWNEPYVLWCLLNPSTADAMTDDQTVRKAAGFSSLWGYQRMMFVNLFAWRSTKPEGLRLAEDPVGPDNDIWIKERAAYARQVVVAWGQNPVPGSARHTRVLNLLLQFHPPSNLYCLGHNANGHPTHPLMLKYATPLVQFSYKPQAAAV